MDPAAPVPQGWESALQRCVVTLHKFLLTFCQSCHLQNPTRFDIILTKDGAQADHPFFCRDAVKVAVYIIHLIKMLVTPGTRAIRKGGAGERKEM